VSEDTRLDALRSEIRHLYWQIGDLEDRLDERNTELVRLLAVDENRREVAP